MPIVIRAFGCQFKCGQRVVTSKQSMVRHEGQCIQNPDTRSCPTCEHNGFEPHEAPIPEEYYSGNEGGYFCAEDHLEKDQRLAKQCPHWKPKNDPVKSTIFTY